jgi:hypothetical protein
VGQRKRDDTKAGAASAKVVPLWPASIRDDLPTGYLEQVARRVQANLTDLGRVSRIGRGFVGLGA